jgi:F0F1-type ATP synthase membrane subunit b/b'
MVIGGVFKALWGVDFRSMIMLVAPLIFIGAIVYSYIVWPKEDAERFAKELDRIQDGLSAEIKRLLSELQRDKQSKVTEHIDSQKKSLLRTIDALSRQTQQNQNQAQEQQRQQAQKRLTQIEQQIKELQTVEREITSLKRQCDTLARDGQQQLTSLAVQV